MPPTDSALAPRTRVSAASTSWISWLRVISIIGVVAIHSVGYDAIPADARHTVHGTVAIWLDIGAVFAVPVFVMISGALLLDPDRYRGHAHFLRRRALRLVPALIFWHLWYWALIWYRDGEPLPWRDAVVRSANGNLYTALYFFWIVVGLALITPLIIGFVATSSRRAVLIAGAGLAAIPALSMATYQIRGAPAVFVDSAWTWWFPYLGLYLLGWGLRGVRLRGAWLAVVSVLTVGLGAVGCWQWRNADAPDWLQTWSPLSYYGAGTILYSIGVYLTVQAFVQPDGLLRVLTRGGLARVDDALGAVTLGVFGFHLTVVWALPRLGLGGEEPASGALGPMLLRVLVTLAVSFAVALVARRVPLLRRVV